LKIWKLIEERLKMTQRMIYTSAIGLSLASVVLVFAILFPEKKDLTPPPIDFSLFGIKINQPVPVDFQGRIVGDSIFGEHDWNGKVMPVTLVVRDGLVKRMTVSGDYIFQLREAIVEKYGRHHSETGSWLEWRCEGGVLLEDKGTAFESTCKQYSQQLLNQYLADKKRDASGI
jgi:hypothetical protein